MSTRLNSEVDAASLAVLVAMKRNTQGAAAGLCSTATPSAVGPHQGSHPRQPPARSHRPVGGPERCQRRKA